MTPYARFISPTAMLGVLQQLFAALSAAEGANNIYGL
jgi:hypothetical protein